MGVVALTNASDVIALLAFPLPLNDDQQRIQERGFQDDRGGGGGGGTVDGQNPALPIIRDIP